MIRCRLCVMPSTRPDTPFTDGVCSACISYAKRKTINWDERGEILHAILSVATSNNWGQFSAIATMMIAPENLWSKWSPTLYEMGSSFRVTNPSAVAGQRNLPQNHPLDSSTILSPGEYKSRSEDRNSLGWQEAMLGFERGLSHDTDTTYDMPLNTYDPTVGGYRNPNNPSEILDTNFDQE